MSFKKLFAVKLFIIFNFITSQCAFADNHNIYETLELIQKNIKTLEKAVYSGSVEINNESGSSSILNDNSEDVLTKHLLIPWQWGANWFHDTLLDADFASNYASWQWVAGCGADAAPYFRIFNPITQSSKFDQFDHCGYNKNLVLFLQFQ